MCATLAWRRHVEKNLPPLGSSAPAFARRQPTLAYEGYDGGDGAAGEENEGSRLPRIVYSSRTHSQLKQVVQELKNTTYRPRVAVLGSREHLCVHEKVGQLRGTRQNLACRSTVKAKKLVAAFLVAWLRVVICLWGSRLTCVLR